MESITISETIIVVCALLMISAVVTPFLNGFFRKPKCLGEELESSESIEEFPKVSILLTPHENGRELIQNLPLYLEQDYPAGFEIVIVVWKGDTETEEALKRFAGYPNLYTTYIPESSRYMSRKKLAITIGVKAAKNEWILMSDIECKPNTPKWLATMTRHCNKNKEMVIGYTAYDNETEDYRRFERLLTAMYLIREDHKGTPYRHNGSNLLFRKDMFIGQDGFRGNLKYIRGEYDFLVNKYATKENTTLELHPDSWMIEQKPTDKQWQNKHMFYMESRKHMQRSWLHRMPFNIDQYAMHINYLMILAALAYSIVTRQWIITAVAGVAFITTLVLRTVIGKKAITLFLEDISSWKIIPFEISIIWHQLSYILKYQRTDKYDFICHKI